MSNTTETEINPILNSDVPVTEGMQDPEQTRRCPHCNRSTPISSFKKLSPDGQVLKNYISCVICRENATKFYKKNRDKILEKNVPVPCECGMLIAPSNMFSHKLRSVDHRHFMSLKLGRPLTKEECSEIDKEIMNQTCKPKIDQKEKIVCECGSEIQRHTLNQHKRSKKHMYYEVLKKIASEEKPKEEDEVSRDEAPRDNEEPDFFYL